MRRCRSHQPQGPRTASRFEVMAARIFRRQTEKKRAKNTATRPRSGSGTIRMIQPWNRCQKMPVTWKEPRSRQDHPRSGAWGGLALAGAVTVRARTFVASPTVLEEEGGAFLSFRGGSRGDPQLGASHAPPDQLAQGPPPEPAPKAPQNREPRQ